MGGSVGLATAAKRSLKSGDRPFGEVPEEWDKEQDRLKVLAKRRFELFLLRQEAKRRSMK